MPDPAVFSNYYESPSADSAADEIWCYCDRPCYSTGDTVLLQVSTGAAQFDLDVVLETREPRLMLSQSGLSGQWYDTPSEVSVTGCNWPTAFEFNVPDDWPSGAYRVTCRIETNSGVVEQHGLFLLRSNQKGRQNRLLMVSSTGTWWAYNNWGGSNHYEGITGAGKDQYAPVVSLQRPLARGFVVLPDDAPRAALAAPPAHDAPVSYPHMEWAWANGYSKKYASAGWASYERHFMHWARATGFEVDITTQYDLQMNPSVIEDYPCLIFVGHDEYWSWEMRDSVDAYVEAGGKVARFAGNFMWQTRLEEEGRHQVCYKYRAQEEDPLRDTDRISTSWEAPGINRPGAMTFGLNALHGVYAGWGGCVAFGSGGFPVYRPDHWAFDNTGLGYGDILGARSRIFAYEVDGLNYEIRDGLPYPSEQDPVPEGLEILALGLASNDEVARGVAKEELFLGFEDCAFRARVLYGEINDETMARASRGSGMIVSFEKGQGEVFHAGSVEWVAGLLRQDAQVEQVTKNVLRRFSSSKS